MKKIISSALAFSLIFGTAFSVNMPLDNDITVEALTFKTTESGLKYEEYPTLISIVGFEDETIESIEIPEKISNKQVKYINKRAFYNCTNLKEITFPESLTDISESCIERTAWYQNQPDGVVYAGKFACGYKGEISENTTLVFKDDTKKILNKSFNSQKNIVSIELSNNITYIGENAFEECSGLTELIIPGNIGTIGTEAFQKCENIRKLILEEGIVSIQRSAFDRCYKLEKVVVPNSVNSLGWGVFGNCRNLEYAKLPDTLEFLTMGLFCGCSNLKSISIPDTVTFIGKNAFTESGLIQIIVPESVEIIESPSFGTYIADPLTLEEKAIPGFKIYGIKGTAAEEYANKYSIEFIEWDGTPLEELPPNTDVVTETTTNRETTVSETSESVETSLLPEATLKGDANNDGTIDIKDIALISGYMINTKKMTEQQLANADLIKDNIVDLKDLSQLKRFLIEEIDVL